MVLTSISENEQCPRNLKKGDNAGDESGEQHAIGLLTQRSFTGFNIVTWCTEKDQFSEEPLYTWKSLSVQSDWKDCVFI